MRMRQLFVAHLSVGILVVAAAMGCGTAGDNGDQVAQEDETPSLDIDIPAVPTQPAPVVTPTPAAPSGDQVASAPSPDDAGQQESSASASEDLPVDEGWGHLRGRFVYQGDPPQRQPVNITQNQEVCGKFDLRDETLIVNPANKGIANVIVWLYTTGAEAVEAHPSYAETANAQVLLDNENCRFSPHVCVVRTTQTLQIGNSDPVGHNTKLDLLSNPPSNDTLPAGATINKQFSAPERLPGLVGCNIHPWMNGRIVIKEHPYVAVSDEDGNFVMKNLPEGTWTFQVYHNAYVDEVAQGGKDLDWSRGRFEMEIRSGVNELGEVQVKPEQFNK